MLERFEDGAAAWRRRTGGSVVELHAYALPYGAMTEAGAGTKDDAARRAGPGLPGDRGRRRSSTEEWLVRDDCPLVGTGPWHLPTRGRHPRPAAGAGRRRVRCDFPVALMERAATTGFQAANALLGRWGLAGHDLWTVPTRTRHPQLVRARRLLAR